MKTVILGAGASYDSFNKFYESWGNITNHEWRPPLGKDLFGSLYNFRDIYDKYPGAKTYSHDIQLENDIEDFFQRKWDFGTQHNDKITLANIINSQYYLQELFSKISNEYSKNIGTSNYSILIKQAYEYAIKTGEDVAFITFNYDNLLERSLADFYSKNEFVLEDYIKDKIKIFKPHGSYNWFRRFKEPFIGDPPNISGQIFNLVEDLEDLENKLDSEIFQSDHPLKFGQNKVSALPYFHVKQKLNKYNDSKYFHVFPQILIPIKTKDAFVIPKAHEVEMIKCISKTKEILIIGWKGQEEHFLKCLKENIGEKKVEITTIIMCDQSLEPTLRKVMPNSIFKDFHFEYEEIDEEDDGTLNTILTHKGGSFSSYILHITKGHPDTTLKYKSFFHLD